MSSKSILAVAVIAVVVGLAAGKSTKNILDDPWYSKGTPGFNYDCSGKEDGNYPHPTLCTHYVACVAQTHAYEMICATNLDGSPLHYVASSGPDPVTSRCDYPAVAGCEGPQPTQTPAPTQGPTTQSPPVDECKDHDCRQDGDCTSFQVCAKGQWQKQKCGQDLFWNPEIENGFGGACDYYNNLSDKVKDQYLKDESCIPPCEWWQEDDEKCSGTFHFRAPFDTETLQGRESTLTCPNAPAGSNGEALVWNPDTRTCDRRTNVGDCNASQ